MLAGGLVGSGIGVAIWFLAVTFGLPKFLIYISGIWAIEPLLRLLGLHGQVILILPMLFVSVASFFLYGLIAGKLFPKLFKK